MTVNYVCVAFKQTVLAQAAANTKQEQEFSANIEGVLKNFVGKDNMRTCEERADSSFAVMVSKGVTYAAFTGAGVKRNQLYGMLTEVQQEFSRKFSADLVKFAQKLQMQREFQAVLQNCAKNIRQYGSNTAALQSELQEVKGLVMDNINAVMKRAAKLDEIETDAHELKENAADFLDNTGKLKREMNCKRISTIAAVVGGVAVVIIIVVGASTGWFGLKK